MRQNENFKAKVGLQSLPNDHALQKGPQA